MSITRQYFVPVSVLSFLIIISAQDSGGTYRVIKGLTPRILCSYDQNATSDLCNAAFLNDVHQALSWLDTNTQQPQCTVYSTKYPGGTALYAPNVPDLTAQGTVVRCVIRGQASGQNVRLNFFNSHPNGSIAVMQYGGPT